VVTYVLIFIYYLVGIFIVNFFRSSVYIAVQARFSGQSLTFKQTLSLIMNHINRIFMWSLITATVGLILQIISDRSKLLGKIVASIIGAAWNILTYFSLPVLLFTDMKVTDSFKESAGLIRKNWGELIIVNFGVGFIFSLVGFLIFALAVGLAVIFSLYFNFLIVLIVVFTLFILAMIVLSILSSTLSSIFKLVIYNYAKNGVVQTGFSQDIVIAAVKSK
jgi:hypothetical protein